MNLLITGAWNQATDYIKDIETKGHKVKFMQFEKDELPCSYDWVEGVVCNGLFLSHSIEKFVNLKYIQLTSAGFDRVSMDYVKEHDIEINNARGVYSIPMAEFAITGVLQLYKQMRFFGENQKKHNWEKHRGLLELHGKTVCIVGCGNVGTECAKRFRAFGTTVLGVDMSKTQNSCYNAYYHISNIKEAIVLSDIVVLTLPLFESTYHMFDRSMFDAMKNNSVLVNISRGAIVNESDLITALETKKLSGAVLDVFEKEPLDKNNLLWDMKTVILSPHNSFASEKNNNRLNELICKNLEV